jgi:3-oxoacyl-[acyl-carrier protein] reductase
LSLGDPEPWWTVIANLDSVGAVRELDGKGAVVTGGSRGIGRAIVTRLVADGARVVFAYRQDDRAAAAVSEATAGRATGVRVDLAEPGAVGRLFEAAAPHLDGLDILVNNAGTVRAPLFVDASEADYDAVMDINTRSVFLAIQHAARHMREGGRIVNLSTVNTREHGPGLALYAGSKAAVELFTRVAAKELGPRGITVNAVSPGATDTDLLRASNKAAALEAAVAKTPLRRLGQPEDIADVVAFLVGHDGRWVTGQNIVASGGLG